MSSEIHGPPCLTRTLQTTPSLSPDAWKTSAQEITRALNLIRDARDNIDGCIAEVKRVLT
jgi:hypothetical protein